MTRSEWLENLCPGVEVRFRENGAWKSAPIEGVYRADERKQATIGSDLITTSTAWVAGFPVNVDPRFPGRSWMEQTTREIISIPAPIRGPIQPLDRVL